MYIHFFIFALKKLQSESNNHTTVTKNKCNAIYVLMHRQIYICNSLNNDNNSSAQFINLIFLSEVMHIYKLWHSFFLSFSFSFITSSTAAATYSDLFSSHILSCLSFLQSISLLFFHFSFFLQFLSNISLQFLINTQMYIFKFNKHFNNMTEQHWHWTSTHAEVLNIKIFNSVDVEDKYKWKKDVMHVQCDLKIMSSKKKQVQCCKLSQILTKFENNHVMIVSQTSTLFIMLVFFLQSRQWHTCRTAWQMRQAELNIFNNESINRTWEFHCICRFWTWTDSFMFFKVLFISKHKESSLWKLNLHSSHEKVKQH